MVKWIFFFCTFGASDITFDLAGHHTSGASSETHLDVICVLLKQSLRRKKNSVERKTNLLEGSTTYTGAGCEKRTHSECCSLLIYSINSSPFSGSAWDVLILEKINFFLADSTFTMPRHQLDTVCYYYLHINRSACDLGLREHHNRKSIVEIYSCDLMRISISFSIEGVAGDFTLPTRKLAFRRKILQRAGRAFMGLSESYD